MNRRGFIGKAMAALAGLCGAIHFASANEGVKREVSGITTGLGINFYDLAAAAKPPNFRVLVMESWWIERDDSDFSMVRSDIATQEMREANPFKPRKAIHWRYIQFEELKKGDHFRVLPISGPALHNLVYIARADAEGGQIQLNPGAEAYEGKGAGFDWYDIEWPYALPPIARKPLPSPREFPYRFD
jgi:hypothetical protein